MDSGTNDDGSVKGTHDSECEDLVGIKYPCTFWLVKRVTIGIAYLGHAFTGAGPKKQEE